MPNKELDQVDQFLLEQWAKWKGYENIKIHEPIHPRFVEVAYLDDGKVVCQGIEIDFDFLRDLPIEDWDAYCKVMTPMLQMEAGALLVDAALEEAYHNASLEDRKLARYRSRKDD